MQAEGFVQVFKRGKGRKHVKEEAVCITLQVLEDLSSLPLPTAAARLGLSSTALKGACRKLGIQRWPYFQWRGMSCVRKNHDAPMRPALQDAATQTDVSFGGVYGCDVPALVDAEAEWEVPEDVPAVWCDCSL